MITQRFYSVYLLLKLYLLGISQYTLSDRTGHSYALQQWLGWWIGASVTYTVGRPTTKQDNSPIARHLISDMVTEWVTGATHKG